MSFCFVQKRAHGAAGVETGVAGGDSAITLLEEDISGGARDYHGVSTPDLAVAFWWLSDIGVRFVALG